MSKRYSNVMPLPKAAKSLRKHLIGAGRALWRVDRGDHYAVTPLGGGEALFTGTLASVTRWLTARLAANSFNAAVEAMFDYVSSLPGFNADKFERLLAKVLKATAEHATDRVAHLLGANR